MNSRSEKLLRCCSNMKEISKMTERDGELKAAIQSSLKNVTGLIQERFEKLALKGKKFKILEAVSDEDLWRQFAFVHDIDPTLQLGIGQTSELLKKDDLQAWFKKHCRARQYSFQIKKCKQAPPSEIHKEQAFEEIQSKVECLPAHIQQLVKTAIQQVKTMEGLLMLLRAVNAGTFGVDVVRTALDLQICTTCKAATASFDTLKKLMWLPDPQYKDPSREHYKPLKICLDKT